MIILNQMYFSTKTASITFNNSIKNKNLNLISTAYRTTPFLVLFQMASIYFIAMTGDVTQLAAYPGFLFHVILWISDRVTPLSLHHPPCLPANTQDSIFITLP